VTRPLTRCWPAISTPTSCPMAVTSFSCVRRARQHHGIHVGSLDSDQTVRLLPWTNRVSRTRRPVIAVRPRGSLMAQPFDAARLRLSGQPQAIAAHIADRDFTRFVFSVSDNGVLAFRASTPIAGSRGSIERGASSRRWASPRTTSTSTLAGRNPRGGRTHRSPDRRPRRLDHGSRARDPIAPDFRFRRRGRFVSRIFRPTARVAFTVGKDGRYAVLAKPV
jgi:hypothetical protein